MQKTLCRIAHPVIVKASRVTQATFRGLQRILRCRSFTAVEGGYGTGAGAYLLVSERDVGVVERDSALI